MRRILPTHLLLLEKVLSIRGLQIDKLLTTNSHIIAGEKKVLKLRNCNFYGM